MNPHEIISSGLLESYVLGSTTPEETALVQRLCLEHPELLKEIEAIEASLMSFSTQLNKPLNPQLKENITGHLQFDEKKAETEAKEISLNKKTLSIYKLGIAASLFVCAGSLFYNLRLRQKLDRLSGELAELTAAKSYMAEELQVQNASFTVAREQLQIASDPRVKKIALKGMNSMASKAASILWNTETKEVYFNANAMPVPAGKQYQLWAIVNGKPVDAGLIDADGNLVFQKMKIIPEAQAFAVTLENMGGSATPSLETMCLLGNV